MTPKSIKSTVVAISASIGLTLSSSAVVTINMEFGSAYDAFSAAVPVGTLWALVVDTDNNDILLGTALNSSMTSTSANSLFTANQSINIGTVIGGDTVFAMGGFNSAGGFATNSLVAINLSLNGAAAGRDYAFVWFPGAVFTGSSEPVFNSTSLAQTIGSQVGSISRTTHPATPDASGTILPSDGATENQGITTIAFGGTATDANFTAVQLVPEPSSFLLTSLALFGFVLRRKR